MIVVLLLAAAKPNTFHIQRSILITAPPEKIFSLINDFHNWSRWAPQDREDSHLRRSYAGSVSGVGAVSEWVSNGSAGAGRMAITSATPARALSIQTDFRKPFVAHNVNEFVLDATGSQTKVTWSMQGSNLYFMRLMSVFVSMDRLMGKHFESGLQNLKAAAEERK